MVRNRGQTCETLRMRRAEVGEPLVVDPHDFHRGLGIVHPSRRAEDSIEHFALYAVEILILDPEPGLGETANAALAILVEARGGHAVRSVNLARHVLASGRAHAARTTEAGAFLRDPLGPFRF